MNNERVSKLENVIKQMLQPIKNIPLDLVIEWLSWCKVLPFDKSNKEDNNVLSKLVKVAKITWKNVNKDWILRPRPNEVWNDIEPFVKSALNKIWYKADTPKTSSWKKKSTWYPDIEFLDNFWRYNYLECKTFNIKNINTTQRSFYLSPSSDFKITKNAHHFVISFEIYVAKSIWKKNLYKCKSYKILTIEDLDVDVKYEFNSDNSRMYSKELIIAEWII